ncbi:MAG: hypothetical protein WCK76_12015 [Elusimicrobiota bacterium]
MVPDEKEGVKRPVFGRGELAYFAAVAAVFAVVSLLRPDLVAGAFRATMASLSAGGGPALKVSAEMLLFGGILVLTFRTVPFRAAPAEDALIVAAAALYGYLAEAWGTRTGLWTYYTGETPPLWIVPAWFIGALIIERLSGRTMELMERRLPEAWRAGLYRAWLAAFWGVFLTFSAKGLLTPAGIAITLLISVPLFCPRRERSRDAAILFTGTACVFFADLWGTTNNCWRYHIQHHPWGIAYGIAFGALFDSALVLAGIRTAGAVRALLGRSRVE